MLKNAIQYFNIPETLVKYKLISEKLTNFLKKEPDPDLEGISNEIISEFFQMIFKLDEVRRNELVDLISKFFIKIKQVQVLNTFLAYFRSMEYIKEEIRRDYSNSKDFCIYTDIIFECKFHEDRKKIEYEYANKEICEFHLNIQSVDKEKFEYLMGFVEKFQIFFSKSPFHKYQIYIGNFPSPTVFKLYQIGELSALKYNKIKEKQNIVDSSIVMRDCLCCLEEKIKQSFKLTKRYTSFFYKAFKELREYLEQNKDLMEEKVKGMYVYGSVTQYSQNNLSDLEVTLLTHTKHGKYVNFPELLNEISKYISENPRYTHVMKRITKRTTLLDFEDTRCNLKIELSLNNYFGVLNSSLIRHYFLLDGRAIILINIIKDWSKSKSINGNYLGHLSSYCYTLMVIYFLQRTKPPVLPVLCSNMKLINIELPEGHHFLEQVTVNFNDSSSSSSSSSSSASLGFHSENTSPVSLLLFQFFMFYVNIFDENEYCIDITHKDIVYRFNDIRYLNFQNNRRCCYCFIDPLDYSYNPGGYFEKGSSNEDKFKKEMSSAIEKILLSENIF